MQSVLQRFFMPILTVLFHFVAFYDIWDHKGGYHNMGALFRVFSRFLSCNRPAVLLAFFWSLGLASGILFAAASGETFFLLVRTAASRRVSIVGLVASCYLPFLLSAFAVFIGKQKLLYPIVFLKALLFSWCAIASSAAFSSAGWLVRPMLQFTDILTVPVLCWFSLRHTSDHGMLFRDFSICTLLFVLAGSLDYCLVSPFLASLIDH